MKSRQRIVSDEDLAGFFGTGPPVPRTTRPGCRSGPVQARLRAARRSTYIGGASRGLGGTGNSVALPTDPSNERTSPVSACRRCESGAKVSAGHCHGLGGCEFFHVDWDFSAPIR